MPTSKTAKPKISKRPTKAVGETNSEWWKTGVIYQLYVRSFYDTNGDGVGDLPGVIAKLDYLKDLGIDAIWLSPVTVSANADWGYDVVDYFDIDPTLGTMEDFDRLIAKAGKLGIKVITDFVPNHTSIQHPWFQNALTGREAKYRDYYIWRDPKPGGTPPTNWKAVDAGYGTWEYHEPTGQYYLHNFWKEQADLNWRNPKVRKEFDEVLKFWLDRGVAGFRLDVFNMLIKDAQFRDNPKSIKTDPPEYRLWHQRPIYNTSRPEVHEILKHWRNVVETNPKKGFLVGETNRVYDMDILASFYGKNDEINLVFNVAFIDSAFEAPSMRGIAERVEEALGYEKWPAWTGSNHDKPRFPSRWAGGNERKTRLALMIMLSLRGTPVIYYGDELGMEDVYIAPWRLKDPRGKKFWPVDGGRDRARTPMQWEHAVGAGFTEPGVRPWLPYGDLRDHCVKNQREDPDSIWNFTKDFLALRKSNVDLQNGRYKALETVPNLWAWKRGRKTMVAVNMSNNHQELTDIHGRIAIGTDRQRDEERLDGLLHLAPWEGVVVEDRP